MATNCPIDLAPSAKSAHIVPTAVAEAPVNDTNVLGDQTKTGEDVGRPRTEIQVFVAEDEKDYSQREQQDAKGSADQVRDSKKQSDTSSNDTKETHLKPKTSLLTRARNSTINLASLATVTNRFSSASVGNLWHGAGSHHHSRGDYTAGELALDSGESGIRPLDYVARGPFDSYHEGDGQHLSPTVNLDPKSAKSASSNRLLSVASCGSARKMSTKEKCKRQKDAERVEKLRLLVNYLKSGSRQPVVSPVALEADEIELAERYKMHVKLRDDILQDIQTNEGQQQQQQQCLTEPSDRSNSSNKPTVASLTAEHKLARQADANKTNNINHSIGGTSTSSPASSSSTSSMNHAHHSVHDGRSIPQIGDVTWVLRHSISDPGNNFEHSPAFSTASSSPSTRDRRRHHHHHHHHHRNHPTHDSHHSNQIEPQDQSPHQQLQHQQQQQQQQEQPHLNYQCSSCAPSSSYSGSSLSNYCIASGPTGNRGSCIASQQQQQPTSNLNQQSPKMFYIDDMDMIPVFSSSCLMNTASTSAATPLLAAAPISQQQTSTPLTTANSTNCCSQPSTPVIYTNLTTSNNNNNNNNNDNAEGICSGGSSLKRNSSSTSAWTNPQNLATWIDNEVNSLVHDLEAKSQQLQIKNESKHNKSSKKKWLSVTSSHSNRRSSSGAQST